MKKIALIIQNDPIRKRLLEKILLSRGYTPVTISSPNDLDYPNLQECYQLVVSDLSQEEPTIFRRNLREVLNFGKLLITGNEYDQTQIFPSYNLPGAVGLLL
ncbi:hypothetical protein [Salegentibacter sp.]|uniref:hypothetical protein n=1 Tax=Salegentibacter sp. TaxID=1903072 RepID=UPI0035629A66